MSEKERFLGSRPAREKPFKMYNGNNVIIVKLTNIEEGWELDKTNEEQVSKSTLNRLFFFKSFFEYRKWFEGCFNEKLNSKQFIKFRNRMKLSCIFDSVRHKSKKVIFFNIHWPWIFISMVYPYLIYCNIQSVIYCRNIVAIKSNFALKMHATSQLNRKKVETWKAFHVR